MLLNNWIAVFSSVTSKLVAAKVGFCSLDDYLATIFNAYFPGRVVLPHRQFSSNTVVISRIFVVDQNREYFFLKSLHEDVEGEVALLTANFVKFEELVAAPVDLRLAVFFATQALNDSVHSHALD